MREIKFRAWDNGKKDNDSYNERMSKSFSVGDTIVIFNGDLILIEFLKDIDRSNENKNRFEIMQFTGILDKNGVEIYEGDIVEVKYKNTDKFIGSIFYEIRFASYMVTSPHSCYGVESFGTHTNEDIKGVWDDKRQLYYEELKAEGLEGFYKYCEKRYKVIGNIYENPELLKEKK